MRYVSACSVALLALACTPAATCPDARAPTAAAPVPIDVDTRDRDQTVHVVLESNAGTLVARVGGGDAVAMDDSEFQPWECDSRAHATWSAGATVLAARSEQTADNGTPGGWIGTVLPWADGAGVAVRSWNVDWAERGMGERDDELVAITFPDVALRPVYVPGGRLRLMGVIAGGAIVLVSSRDLAHHVVAVRADGEEIARVEVAPSAEVLDAAFAGTELGLPSAAPVDASALALPCTDGGEVCIVRFDGDTLALEHTGIELGDGLALTEDGVSATRGDDCRALPAGTGYTPCGEPIAEYADQGLPVDGSLTIGLEGEASLTEVRGEIALEPRDPESDEDVSQRTLAGVVLLSAPEGGTTDVGFDVIVRGDHLAVSYTRVEDTHAATTRRDLALALPPGSVQAERMELGGETAYRVRIGSTFPVAYSHDCWQGVWVLRAWYEGGGEAFSETYAEYGYCD